MSDYSGTSDQPGSPLNELGLEEHKELLGKIDSDSILKAAAVKGSIYFYVSTRGDDNQSKEELVDNPGALDAAIKNLGIKIRYEDKHHRWIAKPADALKALTFAATYLRKSSNTTSEIYGINAELKWHDERDHENIIHLMQSNDNADWRMTRFA